MGAPDAREAGTACPPAAPAGADTCGAGGFAAAGPRRLPEELPPLRVHGTRVDSVAGEQVRDVVAFSPNSATRSPERSRSGFGAAMRNGQFYFRLLGAIGPCRDRPPLPSITSGRRRDRGASTSSPGHGCPLDLRNGFANEPFAGIARLRVGPRTHRRGGTAAGGQPRRPRRGRMGRSRRCGRRGSPNVHAEKVRVPVWQRGVETGEVTAPWPQKLALTALGGSVPTPEGGLEGEIIELPSSMPSRRRCRSGQGQDRLLRYADGAAQPTVSGYGRAVAVRSERAPRAPASSARSASLIRSIGTDHNRRPTRAGCGTQRTAPKIPAAALSIPHAELARATRSLRKARARAVHPRVSGAAARRVCQRHR